jgi:hypothetical protein
MSTGSQDQGEDIVDIVDIVDRRLLFPLSQTLWKLERDSISPAAEPAMLR